MKQMKKQHLYIMQRRGKGSGWTGKEGRRDEQGRDKGWAGEGQWMGMERIMYGQVSESILAGEGWCIGSGFIGDGPGKGIGWTEEGQEMGRGGERACLGRVSNWVGEW